MVMSGCRAARAAGIAALLIGATIGTAIAKVDGFTFPANAGDAPPIFGIDKPSIIVKRHVPVTTNEPVVTTATPPTNESEPPRPSPAPKVIAVTKADMAPLIDAKAAPAHLSVGGAGQPQAEPAPAASPGDFKLAAQEPVGANAPAGEKPETSVPVAQAALVADGGEKAAEAHAETPTDADVAPIRAAEPQLEDHAQNRLDPATMIAAVSLVACLVSVIAVFWQHRRQRPRAVELPGLVRTDQNVAAMVPIGAGMRSILLDRRGRMEVTRLVQRSGQR